MVFLDEYDSPIHIAYEKGYYNEMVDFMRALLSSVLKDNKYLHKGVLTGILRITQGDIYPDLDNLCVFTILDLEFQDKFGFTQNEVNQILIDHNLSNKASEIYEWHNIYKSGNTTIYNPSSLISYVQNQEKSAPYWFNVSINSLITSLFLKDRREIKSKIKLLISGQSLKEQIDKNITFQDIGDQETALWSLLLFNGYLTYSSQELREGITYCNLVIPNKLNENIPLKSLEF